MISFCFLLVSCFTEPKKKVTTTEKIKTKELKLVVGKNKKQKINNNITELDVKTRNNPDENFIAQLEILVNGSILNFENWALDNKYIFQNIDDSKTFKSFNYYNFSNKTTLNYYSRDNKDLYSIGYGTLVKKEYDNLKIACSKRGYKKVNEVIFKGTTFYIYRKNNDFELSFNQEDIIFKGKNETAYTISIDDIKKKNDLE